MIKKCDYFFKQVIENGGLVYTNKIGRNNEFSIVKCKLNDSGDEIIIE